MSERQEWTAAVETLSELREKAARWSWTSQAEQDDYIAGIDTTIAALQAKLVAVGTVG